MLTAYVRFANALAWHVHELAQGLTDAGHEVLLLCRRDSPLATATAHAPFRVDSRLNLSSANPREVARALQVLARELRDFRPHILNPHCPPGHSYLAMARRAAGVDTALIRTVADPRPPKRNFINRTLHRRHTDGFIFTAAKSRSRYAAMLPEIDRCSQVILPGFRADQFVENVHSGGYRKRFGVRDDQLFAGIIARMSPEKGQELLFEALAQLPDSERDRIVCVVAGEDSRERDQNALRSLAAARGVLPQVRFLGRLTDVRPLMTELDLGIITSTRSEAICRVALEYMSFGIPIVAAEVNILPEVVRPQRNGWVFPAGNAHALADLLETILKQPDVMKPLGDTGHHMVRDDLSLNREVELTLEFFDRTRALKRP